VRGFFKKYAFTSAFALSTVIMVLFFLSLPQFLFYFYGSEAGFGIPIWEIGLTPIVWMVSFIFLYSIFKA
jgi:hypothetical protein